MTGQIIILNGVPRSGKSSIASSLGSNWLNMGVDWMIREHTPSEFLPGIGLRPGGERPELEYFIHASYAELHALVAGHARRGINVVMDIGYHSWYAQPFDPYVQGQKILKGLPVLFVGVHCPIDVIMERRRQSEGYATSEPGDPIPEPVFRWQEAVHRDRIYDLELDTSLLSPAECAERILAYLIP